MPNENMFSENITNGFFKQKRRITDFRKQSENTKKGKRKTLEENRDNFENLEKNENSQAKSGNNITYSQQKPKKNKSEKHRWENDFPFYCGAQFSLRRVLYEMIFA